MTIRPWGLDVSEEVPEVMNRLILNARFPKCFCPGDFASPEPNPRLPQPWCGLIPVGPVRSPSLGMGYLKLPPGTNRPARPSIRMSRSEGRETGRGLR